MALTIDELNIQITADSKNATRALTSLIKKLEKLKDTLNGSLHHSIQRRFSHSNLPMGVLNSALE